MMKTNNYTYAVQRLSIGLAILLSGPCGLIAAQTTAGPPAKTKVSTTTTAPSTRPAEKAKPETIPLSFKGVAMDQIAKFLFEQKGKPVIPHKDVEKIKVTLVNPKPLPPAEALEILRTTLHAHGVAIEEREKTIHLIPIAQISHARITTLGPEVDATAIKPTNQIIRKIFAVRNYDPEKLIDVLKPLMPTWGHITSDPINGKLIIVATVERIIAIGEIIAEMDQPDLTKRELGKFDIKHVDVYEIIPMLEKLISGYLGVEATSISAAGAKPARKSSSARRPPGRPGQAAKPGEKSTTGTVIVKAEKKQVLLIPDPRRSRVIVAAPANVLAQIKIWLKTLDQPKPPSTQYEIIEVQFGDAQDLADQLNNLLAKIPDQTLQNALRIFPFAASGRLIIVGSEQNRGMIKEWLDQIDVEDSAQRDTLTFTLKYADAQTLAENVKELFGEQQPRARYSYYRRRQRPDRTTVTVTANVQRNSVTVVASPEKMKQIADQIKEWDKPFEGEEADPLIITLKYADPEKTKELLESLFTKQERRGGFFSYYFGGQETPSPVGRLFGQFRFEAYPEMGKLVVVSKNKENYKVIEKMITVIDKPQLADVPRIIQLKFAEAETLAEQLNALLNAPGTPTSILRRARLGTFEGFSAFVSPYNRQAQQQTTSQDDKEDVSLKQMKFWWQTPPSDIRIKQPSNLIGKLRIVPNVEQNALLIAAPDEYADAIEKFVHTLDKPGYQVLIKAVIVEVTHDDTTSLGFRFSTDPTEFFSGDPIITENALRGLLTYTFDDTFGRQHTLSVDVDANNLISLLGRITKVKIKSEPKIFTTDNVEAEFFDGQDIPFLSQSQTTEAGAIIETFDYYPVGIRLRVRPHITQDKDVDLTVSLIISSLIPGRTLFGGAIVDRREALTRVVLKDGQTFLISGILREEERQVIRRIPGLGDIPLLGELFKHRELTAVNSELLIFLTPLVIGSEDPHDAVATQPLERMRTLMANEKTGTAQTQPAESTDKRKN